MELADEQHLKEKYRGDIARDYEARRRSDLHWKKEDAAAEAMLAMARAEGAASVLDLPVGTGRFAPLYGKLGMKLTGVDISEDMLKEARAACDRAGLDDAVLKIGDALSIDLPDKSVDVALCVRLMQHLDYGAFETVVGELQRVARTHILLGIHLVEPERRGFSRLLRALADNPADTIGRLGKGLRRRLSGRADRSEAPAAYMTRTDKDGRRVFAFLESLRLTVVRQTEILASLSPGKAISYRFLLLSVPPA
jgi:ubiquinone/menaquinone biosynthesis C-methylase UbiE